MMRIFAKIIFLFAVLAIAGGECLYAAFPEVPQEAKDELGSTYGRPQMSGFVFVNGRYLPPPYTVTRVGNGIFINRIQVQQPIPWSRFQPQVGPSKDLDEDGDFEEVEEEKPSVSKPLPQPKKKTPGGNADALDDLFEDEEEAAPKKEPAGQKSVPEKEGDALDDLFGDDDETSSVRPSESSDVDGDEDFEDEKKTPSVPTDSVELDDLFDEKAETPAPKKNEAEEAEGEGEHAAAKIKREKELLKVKLDRMRAKYEKGLSHNEIYFFSYTRPLINGNYGTARTLIEVLPNALRVSNSWYQLKQQLERGGVYFLDNSMIRMLFRNKASYPILLERLRRIKLDEKLERARRQSGRRAWGASY